MSIAIITVFVFCWLPLSINFLIILYQHSSITHFSCSFWIYYEVTIFICFMISSNYRKALKGRGEGNSIVFHLSFLFGLYFNTIFPFGLFFLYSYCWPCWSCTWINVYFKLKSGVLSWKRDFKSSWPAYWPSLWPEKYHKLSRNVPPLKQLNFFSTLVDIMTINTQYTTKCTYLHPTPTHQWPSDES